MPFDEMAGQFSPKGDWIAYQSNANGPIEICVRPFPGPGNQQQVSLGGGSRPRWSPDGTELSYVPRSDGLAEWTAANLRAALTLSNAFGDWC
jgi:Tol biopolymer transport system component